MAAKFFTGLPLDGPDPECVKGHAEEALVSVGRTVPASTVDHSRPSARTAGKLVEVQILRRAPSHACDESPLADLVLDERRA